jgi:hypothetical protein
MAVTYIGIVRFANRSIKARTYDLSQLRLYRVIQAHRSLYKDHIDS